MDERVLCLPSCAVTLHFGAFNGCIYVSEAGWQTFFEDEDFRFRPRSEVEDDPTWRQIIPYTMLCCGDDCERILCYRRKGDETRLHGLVSAGFGGHVTDADGCHPSLVTQFAMWRELEEELPPLVTCRHVVMSHGDSYAIIDNTTPVGRVHFGVCTRMVVLEDFFDKLIALPNRFEAAVNELQLNDCEPWTRYMLQAIYPEQYPCM